MPSSKRDKSSEFGKTYGDLTVWDCGYKYYESPNGRVAGAHTAYCVCSCGGFRRILLDHLKAGSVVSCGCKSSEKLAKAGVERRKYVLADFLGKKFGRLTVLGEGPKRRKREFACACDCGHLTSTPITSLVTGKVLSCGCARENIAASHQHDTEDFIKDATKTHGENYCYSLVDYVASKEKVEIVCRIDGHGSFFQTPSNHKNGAGCPKCRKAGFNTNLSGMLYVLEAEGRTKVGITNVNTENRASYIRWSSGINFAMHTEYKFTRGDDCKNIESLVLSKLRNLYLNPITPFDGYTEVFCDVDARTVNAIVQTTIKDYYGNRPDNSHRST